MNNISLLNFGNPDSDLSDELKAYEEEKVFTLPSGREVCPNDTEPFYGILSTSEEFYLANPMGTLTLHIIYAKSLTTLVINHIFSTADALDYYVRVDFLDRQFFSKLVVDVPVDKDQIVFDLLVSFLIDEIAINEGTEAQVVTFNLIAVDEMNLQRHIVIGQAEKSLLDFIRGMVASEILLLTRPAKINPIDGGYEDTRSMGTMLIKSAFAYGKFGYGHSNQLLDERMVVSDAVKHCLFPRFSPALDRIQDAGRVLRFKPMRPLEIYPFPVPNVKIGNPLLRIHRPETDAEEQTIRRAIPWLNPSFHHIPQLSQKPFTDWRKKFKSLRAGATRRIAFLRDTCAASPG